MRNDTMKRMMTAGAAMAMLAVGGLVTPAPAAVLVSYNFGTTTGNQTNVPQMVGSNMTATNFGAAATVTGAADVNNGVNTSMRLGYADGFTGSSERSVRVQNSGDTAISAATYTTTSAREARAIELDRFVLFSLTPDTGYQLDLTSITFDWTRHANNTETRGWAMYVSKDAFATSTRVTGAEVGSGAIAWNSVNESLALSDISSTTTFRIYYWSTGGLDSSGNRDGRSFRFDNVVVNGEVELIPEPGSLALLAAGGLLVLSRPRKLRQNADGEVVSG
jgi:hypothetical protein